MRYERRDVNFLEELVATHELAVLNDGQETRFSEDSHSITELTLIGQSLASSCTNWHILGTGYATGSDNEEIACE